MTPYIIINGVSSKTIDGLLIQSLPPITKPKIRTEIEEIDGRDGDIVTTLGYAAYDKPLSIGLKGDFNIDDIIKFFNSRGEVIFSDELDKVYRFAIYDSIDFNKLIRFKTANINLHVQPFKHSADEPPITWRTTGSESVAFMPVRNTGNVYSKPKITITGANDIGVYLGDAQIFNIALSAAGETIIIDSELMNATDTEGNYLNRQVAGDYSKFILPEGLSDIKVTGHPTRVVIDNYSRWI